ncbi:MAG: secretin N-terminal domain-containing protein, partial [Armatimonadota bacterium]|nr:secretin N-terminal domain-containing protein [Armatimonadota bacterium]
MLDFRGADIDNVLRFYSMAAGITITKDPALKGPVTLLSAKKMTLDEAFHILEAVLASKNYRLTKEGPVLRVVSAGQQSPFPGYPSWRSSFSGGDPRSSDSSSSSTRPNEVRVFELKYSDASQMARIINDLFQQRGSAMAAIAAMQARRGGDGREGFRMPIVPVADVRASSDDYTNSVIVNAHPDYMPKVEALIKELDKQVTSTMQTRVFPLEYATAAEVAEVVSSVILATTPGVRTAASQSLPFEQRVRGGGGRTS